MPAASVDQTRAARSRSISAPRATGPGSRSSAGGARLDLIHRFSASPMFNRAPAARSSAVFSCKMYLRRAHSHTVRCIPVLTFNLKGKIKYNHRVIQLESEEKVFIKTNDYETLACNKTESLYMKHIFTSYEMSSPSVFTI